MKQITLGLFFLTVTQLVKMEETGQLYESELKQDTINQDSLSAEDPSRNIEVPVPTVQNCQAGFVSQCQKGKCVKMRMRRGIEYEEPEERRIGRKCSESNPCPLGRKCQCMVSECVAENTPTVPGILPTCRCPCEKGPCPEPCQPGACTLEACASPICA